MKIAVLEAYGGMCECCGEDHASFLTIDHINDDGAEHRRSLGSHGGYPVYLDLIRRGFPDGYRVLCFNCNIARAGNNGICPHELASEDWSRWLG